MGRGVASRPDGVELKRIAVRRSGASQFSWLKTLQRQRLPPRVVAAEAETTPRPLLPAPCDFIPKMIKYPITMAFKVSYRGNNGAQESIIIDAASRPQLFAIGLKPL